MAKRIKLNQKRNSSKPKSSTTTGAAQPFFDWINNSRKKAQHHTEVQGVFSDGAKLEGDNPALGLLENDEIARARMLDGSGKPMDTTVINESGIYHLIFNSPKPEAKAFRKWVTSEVLPSIRETGQYIDDASKNELNKFRNESNRNKVLRRKKCNAIFPVT